MGITDAGASLNVFWITRNIQDSTAFHIETGVWVLDTLHAQNRDTSLVRIKAEKAAVHNGIIYFLGEHVAAPGMPTGGWTFQALTIPRLLWVANPFPNFDSTLIQGPVQVFSILPNGKVLLAGRIRRNGFVEDQAVRLNADGSLDNSYQPTVLNGSDTRWYLDAAGMLHAATVLSDAQGLNGTAILATVGVDGGLSQTSHTLDASWPWCRPKSFFPGQNAFLFETGDLFEAVPPGPVPYPYTADTVYGKRYRFFVSHTGQQWPLLKHAGAIPFGETAAVSTSQGKILLNGPFIQVNTKLLPGIAILNADGTLDTAFKGLHQLPAALQRKFISTAMRPEATLLPSGKILIKQTENSDSLISADTVFRLNPSGAIDPSYAPQRASGKMLTRKDGRLVAVRNYSMQGRPVGVSGNAIVQTRLGEFDAEGNFVREIGGYSYSTYPDTTGGSILHGTEVLAEDDRKGIWLLQYWYALGVFRNYYVRVDTLGHALAMYSPEYTLEKRGLKIRTLPGNRFELTGAIGLTDTARHLATANRIVIDSTGRLDPSVAPMACIVPDQYGRRGNQALRLIEYQADGKLIGAFMDMNGWSYTLRFYPDGRYDPSFSPIHSYESQTYSSTLLGNRLYLGGVNADWYNTSTRQWERYGGGPKNGLVAFDLAVRPSNTGYVLGHIDQVTSPATGCSPAGPRRPGRAMLLRSMPGSHYAFSDTGGNYTAIVDTGVFSIGQAIDNNFLERQVCPAANAPRTGRIDGNGQAQIGQDFINQTYDCPRLDLELGTPRFRLCSKGTVRMSFLNDGATAEPSARIRLSLPQEVRILSSNYAYRVDSDSTLVFDLGRLNPGQRGDLVLEDSVACPTQPDSMARACFSARIEPMAACGNLDPVAIGWDGAWLDAYAQYKPLLDKVRVVIRNRGAAMADSTPATLTSNGYAYLAGKLKLAAGDSLVFLVPPALQQPVSLVLRQTPNCPLGTESSLYHRGTGKARAYLSFGSGLLEAYSRQACPSFRYSLDPNEKTVDPPGDVEPGAELHYTIYFENYGNDTAYVVSVQDSLPAGLDVMSMKLGASSHPCQVEFGGDEAQPVVYFNFNPIKLTGKRQDSVLSKGQVEFSIRTKPGVARGSVVMNRAHIYFDRNPAVTTGYTKTPIARIATEVRSRASGKPGLSIYPNPAQGSCRIVAQGLSDRSRAVRLLGSDGRQLLELTLPADGSLRLNNLTPGIYTVLVDGFRAERLVIIR